MRIIKDANNMSAKQMADYWKSRHGADAFVQFTQVLVFMESLGTATPYFYKVKEFLSK
jgi:hypothetical protein